MADQRVRVRTRLVASVAVLALMTVMLSSCGDDGDGGSGSTTSRPSAPVTSHGSSTSTSGPSSSVPVAVYFVRGEKIGTAGREVAGPAVARAALEELVEGPSSADTAAGLSSAIPVGTKVLGVDIADGVATADLSSAFGSGGGSLSMSLRIAQVTYTLTQFPTVQRVSFQLEHEPITSLGGEGLMLDEPQTRADWESVTPAILVESPVPGASVHSPFHVRGTSNTFEATYLVRLTDSAGKVVYEQNGMATSGTGTRGTFDQTVTYSGAASGTAVLRLWESSAKDGSDISVVEVPVEL
jgi:hypothetical protein